MGQFVLSKILLGFFPWALVHHQQTISIDAALARGENPPVPAVTFPAFDGPPLSLASLLGRPRDPEFLGLVVYPVPGTKRRSLRPPGESSVRRTSS